MHSHSANNLVKNALDALAKKEKLKFKKTKKLFIKGNIHITHLFWEILSEQNPGHKFSEVYHCPGCDKFSLE